MTALRILTDLAPWSAIIVTLLVLIAVLVIVQMVRTSNGPMVVRIRLIGLTVQRGPITDASSGAQPGPGVPAEAALPPASDLDAQQRGLPEDVAPRRRQQKSA